MFYRIFVLAMIQLEGAGGGVNYRLFRLFMKTTFYEEIGCRIYALSFTTPPPCTR